MRLSRTEGALLAGIVLVTATPQCKEPTPEEERNEVLDEFRMRCQEWRKAEQQNSTSAAPAQADLKRIVGRRKKVERRHSLQPQQWFCEKGKDGKGNVLVKKIPRSRN
jgi:hypothetical protein